MTARSYGAGGHLTRTGCHSYDTRTVSNRHYLLPLVQNTPSVVWPTCNHCDQPAEVMWLTRHDLVYDGFTITAGCLSGRTCMSELCAAKRCQENVEVWGDQSGIDPRPYTEDDRDNWVRSRVRLGFVA